MATLHCSPCLAFGQRISGYLISLFVCAGWFLAGCSSTSPAVLSVGDAMRMGTAQPQRVAGVLLWESDQRLTLGAAIALIPGAPATMADQRIAVDLGPATSLVALPWRDTGTVRYLPVIVTVHNDPISARPTLTDVTYDIGEYHLSRLPTDALARITGRFMRRDGQQFLVDRQIPTQFVALQPISLTEFLASRSDILIEGVAVQSVFIPLVIAPITTHP
jgi:hypothetical protein